MNVDSTQRAQEAPVPTALSAPPSDAELLDAASTNIEIACGNHGALCDAVLEWSGNETLAETVSWVVATPVKLLIIVAIALLANRFIRALIRRITKKLGTVTEEHGEGVVQARSVARAEERAQTFNFLLSSAATAIIWTVAFIMIFEALGVSVIPIIASAGVLGLAIGFGAQSIVEDLLRGLFMLVEDQFGVGDRIDVGVVNGTVERVTLRTVVIRDPQGTLWHVPNSEIARVANETQVRSRATLEIGVSYSSGLRAVMAVLERAANDLATDPEWAPHVKEAPEVQGVHELGGDDVRIRVAVWVAAGERRPFERVLRLRLKEALDDSGVEMPNRQIDVWLRGQPQAV